MADHAIVGGQPVKSGNDTTNTIKDRQIAKVDL